MMFTVLFGLAVLFGCLPFIIGVLASQCISALRGTEAGDRLKQEILTFQPSAIVPSLWSDGHPMDTRAWFALQEVRDLPRGLQPKVRAIRVLYETVKLIFFGFVIVLLVTYFLNH
jgi:hypothetical protein